MTRTALLAVVLALASLLRPAAASAGDDPPPGSCGALRAEVVPMGVLDFGAVALKCTNCMSVRLSWDAAPLLDYNDWKGYYGVEADWGAGWQYMYFSFWDNRSLTYDWAIDWQDHQDGLTGKEWGFQVGAFRSNAKADGPKSNATVYVPGPLGAPSSPTGTRTKTGVKLSWGAPAGRAGSQGGSPVSIEKYIVTRLDDGADGTVETTVGEPGSTSFEDPVQRAGGIPYYVYPVDKFGLGRPGYVYVAEEEDAEDPTKPLGCSTGGGALAPGLGLVLALAALARRR